MQLIDIGQEIHEQCGNPGVATSRNWIANLLIVYTTTPNFNFYCLRLDTFEDTFAMNLVLQAVIGLPIF